MIEAGFEDLILDRLNESTEHGSGLRREAMERLADLPGYDWTGIYRLQGDMLYLDEFVGAATDHVEIPVGLGVCGAAVADRENKNIADVRAEANYLACSVLTRSELVVLIRSADDDILGQIDVDSHQVEAFDSSDERLLEKIAAILASRW